MLLRSFAQLLLFRKGLHLAEDHLALQVLQGRKLPSEEANVEKLFLSSIAWSEDGLIEGDEHLRKDVIFCIKLFLLLGFQVIFAGLIAYNQLEELFC